MRPAAILSQSIALLSFLLSALADSESPGLPGLPSKIYGVNLGSWYAISGQVIAIVVHLSHYRLVLESWMLPQEWLDMGGQQCEDCSTCIATEL
jgi:hypothetical protein